MAAPTAPTVSVYGSSACKPDSDLYRQALLTGRLLGEAGATVACGGYAGVMEAVSRGASHSGGRVIGYTVKNFPGREANPYLSEEVCCTDLYQRLKHLIHSSDALLALGGGIGTLVEVALAWNELYMGLIAARPLIVVGQAWKDAIEQLSNFMEITPGHRRLVTVCDNPNQAIETLRETGLLS
jgi:uncharacterized protein (TIGR00725 family)